MAKSLLGGGAAITALLSISLFFHAQTSVAETLASASQSRQAQHQSDASDAEASHETSGAESAQLLDETGNPINLTKTDASANQTGSNPSQSFVATAYALRGRTASGRPVAQGIIAADHNVLPLGTRVRLDAGSYSGEYLVGDTGGAVRGRKIDVWVPSNGEALRFGRRSVKLTVLTYGGRRAAATARIRH